MATTTFPTGDDLTAKLYAKRMDAEVLKKTFYARFTAASSSSLAQEMTELKDAGDSVRYGLRELLTGRGKTESQTLEGNEETLVTYADTLLLGELRHGFRARSKKTIDQQRVWFDFREIGYESMRDWMVDRMDTWFFNQLAGNTAQTDLAYTGMNATIAPDSDHTIWCSTDHTTAATLDSDDKFSFAYVDKAVVRARTLQHAIRPLRIGGGEKYVCFVHPYQALQLRQDTATAGNWFDLQKSRLMGGEGNDNGLFNGMIGEYNGVVFYESTRVPLSCDTVTAASNTRRAVLCGAQALTVAYGAEYGKSKFDWVEDNFDYKNDVGIAARIVAGIKKCRYNSKDYGVIALNSYATAP